MLVCVCSLLVSAVPVRAMTLWPYWIACAHVDARSCVYDIWDVCGPLVPRLPLPTPAATSLAAFPAFLSGSVSVVGVTPAQILTAGPIAAFAAQVTALVWASFGVAVSPAAVAVVSAVALTQLSGPCTLQVCGRLCVPVRELRVYA